MWAEIEVSGRAAHGSRPHLGVDAIVKAGPILTALGELDRTLGARTHPRLGRGSVHASVIAGGAELSTYPARCVVGWSGARSPARRGPASRPSSTRCSTAAGMPTRACRPSVARCSCETEEWVSLADSERVARTLVATARRVCA